MSDLKVYRPDSESVAAEMLADQQDAASDAAAKETAVRETATTDTSDEPEIYSFADWVTKLRSPDSSYAALRAKHVNKNQCCPDCRRVGVVPLMLNDGRIDGSGRLVPGTATLVGFRCQQCTHEWSA